MTRVASVPSGGDNSYPDGGFVQQVVARECGVIKISEEEGRPLIYYRGGYASLQQ